MAKLQEGRDYMLQVLPSWIYTCHVDRVVTDSCGATWYHVSLLCWIERISNHMALINTETPETVEGLQFHLSPAWEEILEDLTITRATPVRALIGRK